MSEVPSSREPVFSRRKIDLQRADIFEKYIGVFNGDVYLSALNCFSRFSFLRCMSVTINSKSDVIAGGIINDNEPNIHVGTKAGAITPRLKSRFIERFEL